MNLYNKLLDYFKVDKVKELEERLKTVEDKKPEYKYVMGIDPYKEEKLISKVIYNVGNGSVSVILTSGDVFDGNVDKNQYEQILKCNDKQCLISILSPKTEEKKDSNEDEIKEIIKPIINILEEISDFEVVGDKVYLKNVKSLEIPSSIVAEFIRILDTKLTQENNRLKLNKEYQALLMFTYKLLLNPMEESRNDCLTFVKNFDIKLTNTGNMVMYRRICSVGKTNKELVEFISKQYLKVKSQKKSPKNYFVNKSRNLNENHNLIFIENSYMLVKNDIAHLNKEGQIGNLNDLYLNLSEISENRYTDNYTKSYNISIGSIYKIREEDILTNAGGSCKGALHLADGKVFSYSAFGDTPVVCIVSPQHVYKMDSGFSGKIGVKEMFIAAVTTQDEYGNYEDIDNQEIVEFDEIYHNQSLEELKQDLNNKSLNYVSAGNKVCELSMKEILNISEILKNRTITV